MTGDQSPSPPLQSSHKAALHPGLGHPAATTQLQELRDAEDQRHCHLLEHTQQHMASIQACILN